MLNLFFGDDVSVIREKAFKYAHECTKGEVVTISLNEYQIEMLTELAQGESLFSLVSTYVLDTISEDAEKFDDLIKNLDALKESKNNFIVIESTLNAERKKHFKQYAKTFEEYSREKREKFNAFLMTDALLRRDKKTLWLLLTEGWRAGLSNEEIIGVLLWQVKILRLAEKTKTAEEAGQKQFVYSKAKRALSEFSKGEVDMLSRTLLTIYHDGHLGKVDTAHALEGWVLRL